MNKLYYISSTLLCCVLIGSVSTKATDDSKSYKNEQPRPVYLSPSKDDGPNFLAAMINQLSTERTQIMGPTPVPEYDAPPISLSQGQLGSLYKNAVKQLGNMYPSKPVSNHFDDSYDKDVPPGNNGSSSPGYYYYYFPITDKPDESNNESSTDMNDMMDGDGNGVQTKQVEPLFVAIASFVGLSTLFAFSVLFLPKLGSRKRSEPPNDLIPLTNVIMEAIEGGPEKRTGEVPDENTDVAQSEQQDDEEKHENGCSARLACEVGRVLRKMHLHRGPLRALERILPDGLGRQVQRVRESAQRRVKCSTIRCQSD